MTEASAHLKAGEPETKEPLVHRDQIVISRADFGNDATAKAKFIGTYGLAAWESLPARASRDSMVVETVDDLKSSASKKLFIERYGFDKCQEIVAAGARKRKAQR